jgi:hypothetical protein
MCKNFLFLFKRKARKIAKSVKSRYGKQGKAKRIEETHRQREIEEHRILKKTHAQTSTYDALNEDFLFLKNLKNHK